jgi:hypothetical protein
MPKGKKTPINESVVLVTTDNYALKRKGKSKVLKIKVHKS